MATDEQMSVGRIGGGEQIGFAAVLKLEFFAQRGNGEREVAYRDIGLGQSAEGGAQRLFAHGVYHIDHEASAWEILYGVARDEEVGVGGDLCHAETAFEHAEASRFHQRGVRFVEMAADDIRCGEISGDEGDGYAPVARIAC